MADSSQNPDFEAQLDAWAVEQSRKAAKSFLSCAQQVGFELPDNILGMAAADMELCARGVAREAITFWRLLNGCLDHAERENRDLVKALEEILEPLEPDCGEPDCPDCGPWRNARAALIKARE